MKKINAASRVLFLAGMFSLVLTAIAPSARAQYSYYALSPCRVVDTRNANGVNGGPIVACWTILYKRPSLFPLRTVSETLKTAAASERRTVRRTSRPAIGSVAPIAAITLLLLRSGASNSRHLTRPASP